MLTPKIWPVRNLLKLTFRPKTLLTVSQWADANRWMARGVTAEPGRWDSKRLPYQADPMNAATTSAGVVMCWGSQLGKTEVMLNIVGYHMDVEPSGILVVYPTLDAARTWSTKKLARMIRETPSLRDLVNDPRSRDSGNTIFSKDFPGGDISIAGSNSAPTLRGQSRKVILQDEIDAFEASAGTEGDPMELADKRAENFTDAVFVKSSTPNLAGMSRIERELEHTDKNKWFCPCPRCGHFQCLEWSQVQWPENKPQLACYVCESCKAELNDFERVNMVRNGEWRPTHPETGRKGYILSGLNRIMGLKTKEFGSYLHWFAADFLAAKHGGRETLKVWVNTFKAEAWKEDAERIEINSSMARCEPYGPELPAEVCLLTGAVDVQKDRLELEVIGWNADMESWGITRRIIKGQTNKMEVWKELGNILDTTWKHTNGATLGIACVLVDSGYAGSVLAVYHFCKQRLARRTYPCRGSAQPNSPLIAWSKKNRLVPLVLIGTDIAKSTVFDRLGVAEPGPRFCHFPNNGEYDEEFFQQLTSEEVRTVYVKGHPRREWHKTRARNEALDIRAYNIAALEVLNPDWPRLMEAIAPTAERVKDIAPHRTQYNLMARRPGYVNRW